MPPKKSNRPPKVVRNAMMFERVLHRWEPWLESVAKGRKVIRGSGVPTPSLTQLKSAAKKALTNLGFPPCALFELYWLCCVYATYETAIGFKFDKLVLPTWFPFPFGFKEDDHLDFKGKRIYPPEVWDEADRLFWFKRQPLLPKSRKEWERRFAEFPDTDYVMLLPPDHSVRKLFKRGRPIKTTAVGETLVE